MNVLFPIKLKCKIIFEKNPNNLSEKHFFRIHF